MPALSRRDLGKAAALVVMARSLDAAAGDLVYVHPELRPFAAAIIAREAALPPLAVETLAERRTSAARLARPALPAPAVVLHRVAGPAEAIPVHVINATAGARRPAILHTHGGGFYTGSAGERIADLQGLATTLDCVIATVDYRLAPETTFAGSVADNYAALLWLHGNAARLGVDPAAIAVMGESAGGGHAALLALKARDEGEVPLAAQVLIYPMLDDRTGVTRRPRAPIGTILWTEDKNRFGWRCFLGQPPGADSVPAAAVPARRTDLAGLAPAFIGVGSLDLFVDEDLAYARGLIDAGVATEVHVVPGAFHGFDGIAEGTAVAKAFTAAKIAALQRAFDRPAG